MDHAATPSLSDEMKIKMKHPNIELPDKISLLLDELQNLRQALGEASYPIYFPHLNVVVVTIP